MSSFVSYIVRDMSKTVLRLLTSLVIVLFISGCKSTKTASGKRVPKPKNIILLIGDGMGLTQISTLYMEKDNTNNFSRFYHIGFINTESSSDKITDSAAGATAFACGIKTYNNSVGMNSDTVSVPNLVELFTERKYKTGVISTSSITHATPASFFAHTNHRRNQYDIAGQLVKSDIDFFAGGGTNYFRGLEREIALYNWKLDSSACCGFKAPSEWNSDQKYGYLYAPDGLPKMSEKRGDFLTNASKGALNYFGKQPYFLMVEGSQIDWGGHDNDYDYVVAELKDFDETIGAILDYAEKDGNTLVIVTADHETGGLALGPTTYQGAQGKQYNDYGTVDPSFSTGGHTACLIPVFAYGPGAEHFQGMYENNEIFSKISDLMR